MKVIAAVILALGSVSALGSGPYLPSGWRPQGPAFFLPTEIQKPSDSPSKETILVETEASSSDSFREYGPPKIVEVSENFINQGLPDVVTEQTFLIVEKSGAVNAEAEVVVNNENAELVQEVQEVIQEATTEAQVEETTELVLAEEGTTAEAITVVEEKLERVAVEEEQTLEQIKSISDTLVSLEKEIKSEQVQSEAVAELKINQEGSGSAAPEGFLEYGPPGFREYGPPKDALLRSAVVQEPASETNEARRRRFSPKFRSSKAKRS